MGTPQEFYNYAINKVFNNRGQIMNINYVQTFEKAVKHFWKVR